MRKFRGSRIMLALLGAVTAGLAAVPAIAQADGVPLPLAAVTSTLSCSDPVLTQALLGFGDANLYSLAPGQSVDSFDGTGWTLLGNASIVATDLFDGSAGQVLDLPSGSAAISPEVCVNSTYRTARVMVHDLSGSDNVSFYAGYPHRHGQGSSYSWTTSQVVDGSPSASDGWGLSDSFNLAPGSATGWQVARFAFVAGGQGNESQLYDFYLDPYSRG
jgi:hypothetical protein